jgi:hypothetical protein
MFYVSPGELGRTLWREPLVNPIKKMGFARSSPYSVLLVLFQSYVEHDLRKHKIVIPFFCQPINFYELIVMF